MMESMCELIRRNVATVNESILVDGNPNSDRGKLTHTLCNLLVFQDQCIQRQLKTYANINCYFIFCIVSFFCGREEL